MTTPAPPQVEVQEARTEIVVTDGIGPLSREDVQRIVDLVLRHLRHDDDLRAQRERDTGVGNRVYPPHVR